MHGELWAVGVEVALVFVLESAGIGVDVEWKESRACQCTCLLIDNKLIRKVCLISD